MRALNQEESKLTTEFRTSCSRRRRPARSSSTTRRELAGLSDAEIAAAAEAAKERGLAGKWVIAAAEHDAAAGAGVADQSRASASGCSTRRSMRAERGDANDTRAIIRRLAQLRAERAKLLGFPTYAAYALDDQMAKTPENAIKLLTDLVAAGDGEGARRSGATCRS